MAASGIEAMWEEALSKYKDSTKEDLKRLPCPHSAEELIQKVNEANKGYEDFRAKSKTIFTVLSALAVPIETLGNLVAGAASQAFPPSSMVFGAVMYLIQAAKGVSKILDAISDLMWQIQNYTVRLKVYDNAEMSGELRAKLTQILVIVIEILAKSTKKLNDPFFRAKAYARNVVIGNDTEMGDLLAKLEKYTQSENLLVGAETLVETKNTSKSVDAIQVSMAAMQLSQDTTAQGVVDIQNALASSNAQTVAQQSMDQLETLKIMLNPSGTPQTRLEEIKRERKLIPQSGEWMLAEEKFINWAHRKTEPLLWISGNPGSGKSFLTYNVVSGLRNLPDSLSGSGTSVTYFFFRDNNKVTQSFLQALCDIAHQLSRNDPAYANYLALAFNNINGLSSVGLAWNVLIKDYWLTDEAREPFYIVLDGLDEASFEGRVEFYELLKDVEDAGMSSALRIAMLGRPHIIQEMTLANLKEPPMIHVDSLKNGADIALYVQLTIAKSPALKKVSGKLQIKIAERLTRDAGGMFMWVKLMIAELNRKAQRGRETEVEKALAQGPKGLTDMIKHVLESFSSSLEPDEADDLNDMLKWVALARRPLYLGELDAALRLKSEEGEGLICLEDMLRKTYASFFTLSREDGLTTSELLAHSEARSDGATTVSSAQDTDRLDDKDMDHIATFDSNYRSTTVSFSHTSISDYFLNPKHGKVIGPGANSPPVGVDLNDAYVATTRACLEVLVNDSYGGRMKGVMSLLPYMQRYWCEHLQNLDHDKADRDAGAAIGVLLARMLHDEDSLVRWVGWPEARFFCATIAELLLLWVTDPTVKTPKDERLAGWVNGMENKSPIEIFRPAMFSLGKLWLGVRDSDLDLPRTICIIHCWLSSRQSTVTDNPPALTEDNVFSAAEFVCLEMNANFYHGLATAFRDLGYYDRAEKSFERALQLDKSIWVARAGLASVYFQQGRYEQALEADRAVLEDIEADPSENQDYLKQRAGGVQRRLAKCYTSLTQQEQKNGHLEKALEYEIMACQHNMKAYDTNNSNYDSLLKSVECWRKWADQGVAPSDVKSLYYGAAKLPPVDQCFREIMEVAHKLDSMREEEGLDWHWLFVIAQGASSFGKSVVLAAHWTGQIQWLQDRFDTAILVAKDALRPNYGARVALSLADICCNWTGEDERALELYEGVVSGSAFTTKTGNSVSVIKMMAFGGLSRLYVYKAVLDEARSDYWIGKLEGIWDQIESRPASFGLGDIMSSLGVATQLAAWYTRCGRREDAQKLIRPTVQEALAILASDKPNHPLGYAYLLLGSLATRADKDVIGLSQMMRGYKHGISILAADSKIGAEKVAIMIPDVDSEGGTSTTTTNSTRGGALESSDDEIDTTLANCSCDGPCGREDVGYDDFYFSRVHLDNFCPGCFARIQAGEKLPGVRCTAADEYLFVPPLDVRIKMGEIVYDGVVMSIEVWKEELKERWGL